MSFKFSTIRIPLQTALLHSLCIMLWMVSSVSNAQDEPWEFSPYRVRTLVLADDVPELNDFSFERVAAEVNRFAELTDKSGWRVNVERAPAFYQPIMAMGIENLALGSIVKTITRETKSGETKEEKINQLTFGGIALSDDLPEFADIKNGDRIAFVRLKKTDDGFSIETRQLDCQLHLWGPTSHKSTRYFSRVSQQMFESIRETLVPVARIEKIEGKFVRLRIRAAHIMNKVENGSVVPNLESPTRVSLTSIYRPVIRKNDKNGNIVLKDGIREIDWTFLRPVELVNTHGNDYYTKAEIHGAKRSPLAGRTSKSQKKYAVVVRSTSKQTKLTLTTRDTKPKPVPDKKIYLKYPGQDDTIEIGQTDRKGVVYINANEHPLHLIYIRSGEKRVLARLPIVPGYYEEQVAAMQDDKDRLRAEGVLAGFEFSFMDLTVRREVYAMRIRSALEKGNASQGRELYNLFLKLESPDDFQKRLNNDKRILSSEAGDKKQKELIDKMFSVLQVLVQQRLLASLTSELDQAVLTVEKGGTYKPKSVTDAIEKELGSD